MSEIGDNCAVKIAVRERPQRDQINTKSSITYHNSCANVLVVNERLFNFDYALGPETTQSQLYDELIKPLVEKVKLGFNCTALAYGQTGTGKSFTMGLNTNNFDDESVGVIPRCLNEMFAKNENEDPTMEREIYASFIEIYNKKVFDLLVPNTADPIIAFGYKYTGGTRKLLKNIEECYDILQQGVRNRHVRPTTMNAQSSRSHAIFTIHVRSKSSTGEQNTMSCLNLVDLAGSEGVRRTGHHGLAKEEGVHINQGLLCISKVLQAMAQGSKVIPYRDSVLSLVLQDSLSPNSYLTLIACISPCQKDVSETLSTLRFAQSAKLLKRTPTVNTIIEELRKKPKTPFKTRPVPAKNSSPRPFKNFVRPSGIKTLRPNLGSDEKREQLRNTFCTPSKMKIQAAKMNQSEVGQTPKEKQKALISHKSNIPLRSLFGSCEFGSNRESLFDDQALDLAGGSLTNLNISSSTVVDAPITTRKSSSSFSPFARKLTAMSDLLEKFISSSNLAEKPVNTPMQQNEVSTTTKSMSTPFRQELKSIVAEVLAEQNTRSLAHLENNIEVTPIYKTTQCQLFKTSSPVFKKPEAPQSEQKNRNRDTTNSIVNMSIEFSESPIEYAEDSEKLNSNISRSVKEDTYEQTSSSTSLRRSKRISEYKMNKPANRSEVSYILQHNISNGHGRRSVKINHLKKRRTSLLQTKLETPNIKRHSTASRVKKMDTIANISIIASYFEGAAGSSSLTTPKSVKSKKSALEKHKKGILELLNKGSMRELQMLPQVGQKTAYHIIAHRTLNGRFKRFNQVEKLPIWKGSAWDRFAKANMLI